MKGTILAQGVISADDGNRYTYDISEIKNLQNANQNSLEGALVDFECGENQVALNIFITKHKISNPVLNGAFGAFSNVVNSDIRLKGIWLSLLALAGALIVPGAVAEIFVIILAIMILKELNKTCGNAPIKMFYTALIIVIIGQIASVLIDFNASPISVLGNLFVVGFITGTYIYMVMGNYAPALELYSVVPFVIGLILFGRTFYYLAKVTNNNLFKKAFYYMLFGSILIFAGFEMLSVGGVLYLIGLCYMLYAWMSIKELKVAERI